MGAPKINVPPAPVLPPAPDQADIAVQQFGAMFRRRAAAGYSSTFEAGPSGAGKPEDVAGAPEPFRTDTTPPPPPASPPPTGLAGAAAEAAKRVRQPPSPLTDAMRAAAARLGLKPSGHATTATPAPPTGGGTQIVIDPATGLPTEVPVPTSHPGARPRTTAVTAQSTSAPTISPEDSPRLFARAALRRKLGY